MKNFPLDWFDAVSSWSRREKPSTGLKVERSRFAGLIEPLEARIAPATATFDSGSGILTISGDATGESVTISVNGAGTDLVVGGVTGYTGQSLTGLTGIVFDGNDGDDTFVVNLAAGLIGKSITFNGGIGADLLEITGGGQGDVTHTFTSATSGSITTGIGNVGYTGLESSLNTGTSTNVTLQLTAGANSATLGDNGMSGDFISRLGVGAFAADFRDPSGTVAIKSASNAVGNLTVQSPQDLKAGLLLGEFGGRFGTIDLNGSVALGAGKTLRADANTINVAGTLTTTGAGKVHFEAERVTGAGSISTGGGLEVMVTFSNAQLSGAIGGTGGLIKTGNGTLALLGTNTYTGATVVDGGTLVVNGSTASASSVTVSNGSTLAGTGVINGSVTIQSGGTLSPGVNGTGTLTTGNLTFNANANLATQINGPADFDRVLTKGDVTVDPAANVVLTGTYSPVSGNQFRLIDATGNLTGNFNGITHNGQVFFNNAPLKAAYSFGNGIFELYYDTAPVLTGTTGDDTFQVRLDGAGNVVVTRGGTTVLNTPLTSLTQLTINGDNGNDTLVIDYNGAGGFFALPIVFNGGTQAPGGQDTLVITSSPTNRGSVHHSFTNANDGSVNIDGTVITYTGLEPIIDNLSATNRSFTFNGGSEAISLVSGPGVGQLTIDSTLGESVTFANPANSITIDAGTGDDVITIGSLGTYQGALAVDGASGNDSISFNAAVTLSALTLTSATVTQSGAITVLGNTSIDAGTGAVTLSNAANDFQGTVSIIGGAITLRDANALSILNVDAAGDVQVTAGNNLTVGTITASSSNISLTATAGAILDGNAVNAVNINGNNLSLTAANGIELDTAVATLSASNSTAGNIVIREADTITLGPIQTAGGNGNISISNAASNITVSGNVAANGSGTVSINSAGRITVSSGNTISSASGDIALDATLNIQLYGSISTAGNVRVDADSNNNNVGAITSSVTSLVTANTLTLRSAEGIDIRTNASTIDFDNSFTGDVTIRESNGAYVFGDNFGDDIVLDSPTGNWQLGAISAPGSTVVVRTQAGSILDNNGTATNISAVAAILIGAAGVGTNGDAIETSIDRLEASSGNGGVFINETDALEIGGITVPAGALPGPVDGISASGGIEIKSGGALSIVEQITTPAYVLLQAFGAITESGAGRIAAAYLQTDSVGGQILTGNNAVREFYAHNIGINTDVTLNNNSLAASAPGGLTISRISNPTGGDVSVQNNGNVTITGAVTSGTNPTPLGGDIAISSSGLLTLATAGSVSSRGGSGGTLTLANGVTIDGSLEVGYGHVTLVGGAGNLNINAPISVQTELSLNATGNINIAAKVETTLTTSNLTVTADTDLDSMGGIHVLPGGELKAGADLTLIGSNYTGTPEIDSIIIEADTNGAAQLAAFGNIRLLNGPAAPLGAATYLAGYVNAITTGNVTFEHAVQLTADTARVATRGEGNILFNGALDGGFDLRLSTDVGVITFDENVGSTARVGDVRIDSALDVTIAGGFAAQSLTITNAPGTVAIAGPVSTTATGNNFVVNANILNVGGAISAGPGNIVWSVDNLAIEAPVAGNGTFTIQPLTANRSIGLNGLGDLNLSTGELNLLVDGFAGIQIGATGGKSAITVGAVTFNDSVSIVSPAAGGTINVLGTVTALGTAGVTLQAPSIALNVSGVAIDTAGGAVTLTGGVLLGADTTIETVGMVDGGAFTQNGTINGAYNLVVATGSGAIDLNGSNAAGGPGIGNSQPLSSVTFNGSTVNVRTQIVTTGAQIFATATTNLLSGSIKTTTQTGTVLFVGNVNVAPAFSITTAGGSIIFGGGIDAIGTGAEIRLNAPGGALSFSGPVGGTTPLKSLTIQSAASATFGSTVNVSGNISIAADEIDFNGGAGTVDGGGSIELKPASTNVPTHVGGSTDLPGILDLTISDIQALANGFTSITIGRDLGEAGIRIVAGQGVTFLDPVIFEQSGRAGTIEIQGSVAAIDDASIDFRSTLIRFTSPAPVAITTVNQSITFDGVVSFEGTPSVAIDTDTGLGSVLFKAAVKDIIGGTDVTVHTGAGDITFAKTIGARTGATVGAIELVSSGITTLNGAIYAESIGVNRGLSGGPIGRTDLLAKSITTYGPAGQEFNTDVLLNSSIRFNPLQGDIAVRGDVTSKVGKTYSISATAAMGDILFEGNIGTANGLVGNIRAKTKTGDATFSGAIFAKGVAIVANTLSVGDVTTTITQSYTGAATFTGALTSSKLKISSTIDIVSNDNWKITGRTVLKAKGSDLRNITLTGANEFGEIDILAAMNATIHEDIGNLVIRTANVTGTLTLDAVNNIEDGKRIRVGTLIASSAAGSIVLDAQNRISILGAVAAEAGVTILSGGTNVTLTGLISTETGNVILVGNDRSSHNVLAGAGAGIDLGTGGGYYRIYTHDSAVGNLLTLNPASGTPLVEALGNRYPYELLGADANKNAIIASRIA